MLLLLFLWKGVQPFLGSILAGMVIFATYIVAFVFNTQAKCVVWAVQETVVLAFLLYLIGLLLLLFPGGGEDVGRFLRGYPLRLTKIVLFLSKRIVLRGVDLLRRLLA